MPGERLLALDFSQGFLLQLALTPLLHLYQLLPVALRSRPVQNSVAANCRIVTLGSHVCFGARKLAGESLLASNATKDPVYMVMRGTTPRARARGDPMSTSSDALLAGGTFRQRFPAGHNQGAI